MKITRRALRRLIREEVASVLGVKDELIQVGPEDQLAKNVTNQLYDMITQAYADIGGHPKVKGPSSLARYTDWAMADVDDDPEVDLVFMGRPRGGGIKTGVSASDGSRRASQAWRTFQKQLSQQGWWGEVSGAPAHIMINKLGEPYIDDPELVRRLLAGKDIIWHGAHPNDPAGRWDGVEGWYSRDIGGHAHAKIIVGRF